MSLKTEKQSELRILIQKSTGEPEQSKLKNTFLRVNLEWFAIHPHFETFINCNRKKSSFKKFKTLGILEVRIKCTINQEEPNPFLSPY